MADGRGVGAQIADRKRRYLYIFIVIQRMMKDFNSDIFAPAGAEVSIIPVASGEMPGKVETASLPDTLPILALRNAVLFPGAVYPITIGREKSMKIIDEAYRKNGIIGAVPQNDVMV